MPRTPEQFENIREKTKSKILEHSLRLFAEKGYYGTSISDIAKAAGVSKGLAYNYFESKQDLVESIFNQILDIGYRYEELIQQVDDPYKRLQKIIEHTFDYMEENEEFWRLYVSFALQPVVMDTAKSVTKEFGDRMIKMTTSIFKKIGIAKPKAEAYILAGLIDGISLEYFFDKENYPLRSVKKSVLEKYNKESLKRQIK